jgi:hypothetical protein|tara:strand:+ start:1692 stop:2099 length:408 start_codon:yes stop_codon:yes gene_type:complete
MSDEKPKQPKRKVYKDKLNGMMILLALSEYTADTDIPKNREQFDAILVRLHNSEMPSPEQHINAEYVEKYSARISQKFAVIKSRMKELGQEIHLTLPRRTRSVGKEQLAKLESMSHWDAFLVANKKALAKKKNKK